MAPDYRPDIYLASASPRRRELLEQIGVRHVRVESGIEEILKPGESPEVFVLRLALEKARAGWRHLEERPRCPVLGADTVVVFGSQVLGKPATFEQGVAMLERLSGQTHRVLTGIALVQDEREATRLSVSHVTFRKLSRDECEVYWHSGEGWDKAGGYAVQGRAAVFIEHLEGSYTGVMGLPLFETAQLMSEFGIGYQRNW
jgi:septum formation protein